MQAAGIEVYMLTGDNEATAREIARKAGILHYRAGVLPQDKAAFIGSLQKTAGKWQWQATASTTVQPWRKPI